MPERDPTTLAELSACTILFLVKERVKEQNIQCMTQSHQPPSIPCPKPQSTFLPFFLRECIYFEAIYLLE